MLPYLFLVLSAVFLSAMSLLRKEYDRHSSHEGLAASYRFVVLSFSATLLIAAVIFLIGGSFGEFLSLDWLVLLLALAYALATFLTTVICIVGASAGSLTLLIGFARMGTITLSTLYGLIFDPARNVMSLPKALGLLVVAAVMTLTLFGGRGDREAGEGNPRLFRLLSVAIFFTNGVALVIYSLFTTHRPSFGKLHFLAVCAVFCILLGAACLAASHLLQRGQRRGGEKAPARSAHRAGIGRRMLLVVLGYAGVSMTSELFALINTTQLPIIVQAPLGFGISAIVLAVFDRLIYRAPITKPLLLKFTLALLACVLFML